MRSQTHATDAGEGAIALAEGKPDRHGQWSEGGGGGSGLATAEPDWGSRPSPGLGGVGSDWALSEVLEALCVDMGATALLVDVHLRVLAGRPGAAPPALGFGAPRWGRSGPLLPGAPTAFDGSVPPTVQRQAEGAIGSFYPSLLPSAVGAEHAGFMRAVLHDGQPTALIGMIGGLLTRTTFRLLRSAASATSGGGSPLVLVTAATLNEFSPGFEPGRRIETVGPHGVRVVRASHDDIGRFESLTERELEVLRLIGLGHTAHEVSVAMHRSVKTIDGHRMSLGTKLGVSSKIDLARIAICSGITVLRSEDMPQLARHARLAREGRTPEG